MPAHRYLIRGETQTPFPFFSVSITHLEDAHIETPAGVALLELEGRALSSVWEELTVSPNCLLSLESPLPRFYMVFPPLLRPFPATSSVHPIDYEPSGLGIPSRAWADSVGFVPSLSQ